MRARERLAELEHALAAHEAERRATADLFDFVAHELKTPVTSLDAFSYILARDTKAGEDPTGKRCLEGITRNAARLVALVDELLEIGRLRAERVRVERAPLDPGELARAVALEGAGGPDVEVIAPPGPLKVEGDRRRLLELIRDLVRDAAPRAPAGTTVTIRLERVAPDRIRLSAEDRGEASDRALLERAFLGRRRTGDQGPAGERGGLGLTLGHEVVVRHGGSTGAASGPEGNKIWFELPVAPY